MYVCHVFQLIHECKEVLWGVCMSCFSADPSVLGGSEGCVYVMFFS